MRVHERDRARGWALQALYAWEMRAARSDAMMLVLDDLFEHLRISPRNRSYAEVLVRLVAGNLTRIDALLRDALTNWRLERLAATDRNILRIGAAELLFVDDVPRHIVLRASVALAERYGTPDSPRFVHGVLESVARGHVATA